MSDSITSAFSEVTEQTTYIFVNTHKMVFIVLIILIFLAINNIIIYLVYIKLRRTINNYCDNRTKQTPSQRKFD